MGSYSKGFTLLELIIVLAIFTIAVGGILFATRSTPRRELYLASRQLQADIRYTQRLALSTGQHHMIVFELRYNRYRIVQNAPPVTLRTIYFPGSVRLISTTDPVLGFLPRGTSSRGFRIVLGNGNYRQHLTVTVSGGRVEIKDIY